MDLGFGGAVYEAGTISGLDFLFIIAAGELLLWASFLLPPLDRLTKKIEWNKIEKMD